MERVMMLRRAKHRGCDRREVCSNVTCDVVQRPPTSTPTRARTCSRRGKLDPWRPSVKSNRKGMMTVKGSPTKISSSNLENPGASCFPSQISRRAAAQAGGEAHGRRWVWRRRGARSARRPRLRPRCELISNPRDRRAHRQTLMEFARRRAHFFRHLPPPHHESDRSRPSATRRPPSPKSLRPRERRRPQPRLLSTTRMW